MSGLRVCYGMSESDLACGGARGFLYIERPFFDVDIELSLPVVTMNPSLDEIQVGLPTCLLCNARY